MKQQNEENMQSNLETMKKMGQNDKYEIKEGGKDGMELPQRTDGKTKEDLSEGKQKDTKKDTRDTKDI